MKDKAKVIELLQQAMVETGKLMETALHTANAIDNPTVDMYDVMDYCRNLEDNETITERSIDELIRYSEALVDFENNPESYSTV